MARVAIVCLSFCFVLSGWWSLTAAASEEPLADQVRTSITRGVQFLRTQEGGHGEVGKI